MRGGGQLGNGVGEFVLFGVVGDAVSLREVQGGVDDTKRCPDQHAHYRRAGQGSFGIDHRWVDAVRNLSRQFVPGRSRRRGTKADPVSLKCGRAQHGRACSPSA